MMQGPPLTSETSGCIPSTRTYSDRSTLSSARGSSAHSHRRIRHELNYPATTEWAFLTSTPQTIDKRRQYRPVQPSRPSTARESATSDVINLPKRPATSRGIKSQIRYHEQMELLTPRNATLVIQEAVRREQNQEEYVDPLIGRSVEPRGQLGRDGKTSSDGIETKTIELLSRARVVTTAAMNATERLRLRAFQSRANGEYDRAIKFYTRLSTARPNEIEAKFHLAVCLERTGQFTPALAAYKQVQKLAGGQHAFAYYNMGNLCMRAEKIPQAIDYFTRAINASKRNGSSGSSNRGRVQTSGSNIGSTPVVFYRQRAAAYRKNGDFEKAAQDYVHVQKCAEGVPSTTLADESSMYTDERLYQTVKRAASPKKVNPKSIVSDDEDELPKELDIEVRGPNQEDSNEPQSEEEEIEDALTTWALQRSFEIARLPPYQRNESDLQCLTDFMQKRFSVCAALHPDVCKLLCRDLVLSPEGALPARTPIFMEQDEDTEVTRRDHTLYFIFQGRVSASKTAGRMFQPSPQRTERPEEGLETQENLDEEGKCEEETAWESPWNTHQMPVSTEWKQAQLELCELERGDIFGHQGRFTNAPRAYSAVTTASCVIGALSWQQWNRIDHAQHEAERERAARFLGMTPAFHGIPVADIRSLAERATFVKVVGSKAVCCEGQYVDGLLVVREGELCQFSPCGLRSPPDMSVSFNLSGTLSEPQNARAFFTQLETAGDPLRFLRVNEAYHGFLPQNYVISKQRELLRLATARPKVRNVRRTSVLLNCMGTGKGTSTSKPVALGLRRGDCFCISSSWVPPRQSRQNEKPFSGVACAKAALVSVSTAELLFLSSKDLLLGLSMESRSQLHRNLQDIASMDNKSIYKTDLSLVSRLRGPPGKRSSNLLEQFVREKHWSKFKEELVESVLHGRT